MAGAPTATRANLATKQVALPDVPRRTGTGLSSRAPLLLHPLPTAPQQPPASPAHSLGVAAGAPFQTNVNLAMLLPASKAASLLTGRGPTANAW